MTNKHYLINTYGCQMNVHESEKLAGMLVSLGYKETTDVKNADIVVFNTCCIRDGAEQKIFAHIGALKGLKKQNPNLIVAVCGCLSQVQGRADIIKTKFPFVNIVFGTHNINDFKKFVENFERHRKYICEVWENEKDINENIEIYRTSNNNAWVNISYGCNNFCSYCIVPFVRGRERSRDMQEILKEVEDLAKEGYKYVTLLGQNVNSYGNDIKDPNINFANLLEAVAKIEGDFKVKFMTSHPKDLNDDVINMIAKYDKICKVIHLPIQSGSNEILKAMNRNYTKEHYLTLIQKIREKINNCYISTDIIVGFPGETEENFMDTYSLLEKVKYDGVFAFMYSKRDGTVATKLPNQVPDDIKRERVNKLLTLSKQITREINKNSMGLVFDVLIDSFDKEKSIYKATTDSGKTILVLKGEKDYDFGKFYKVKIIKNLSNKLYGEIVE